MSTVAGGAVAGSAMAGSAVARLGDARSNDRKKVFHRTQILTPTDGAPVTATLVDISQGGFMARSEVIAATGDRLWVDLPVLGRTCAEVRWALGGRVGCRFERVIAMTAYVEILHALGRS